MSALQAQEQQRMIRHEGSIEGALQHMFFLVLVPRETKEKERKEIMETTKRQKQQMVFLQLRTEKANILHTNIVGGEIIHHLKYWRKSDMNAESVTNAVVLIICKQKVLQQPNDAHIADQQEEEKLFVGNYFAG